MQARALTLSLDGHASLATRDFAIARAFDAEGARWFAPPAATKSRESALPGFGLSLGYTLLYLGLIVLLPLSAAFIKTAQLTWPAFLEIVTAQRVVAS